MAARFTTLLGCLTRRNVRWLSYHLLAHTSKQSRSYLAFQVCSSHCCAPTRPTPSEGQRGGSQAHPYLLLLGFLGLFKSEDESGDEKVPPSVKRQLLNAQRALRNEDYGGAEDAYHNALKLLATSEYAGTQPYLEARAVTLDKLANMYLEQGQLEEAEANFKETLRAMMTAGVAQENDAVVEISLKLAKIYTNQKRYDLAATGFQWCGETAEKLWNTSQSLETLALWGMCLHGKGQYHLAVREGSEAVVVFQEALRIAEEVYGSSHLQVAVLHNDLATALEVAGEYGEAERHITESLEIAGSVGDKDIAEFMAMFYYNLGTILSRQGKVSSASDAYCRALQHAKRLTDRTLQNQIKKTIQES